MKVGEGAVCHIIRVFGNLQRQLRLHQGRMNWREGMGSRRAQGICRRPGKEAIVVGTGMVLVVQGRRGRQD